MSSEDRTEESERERRRQERREHREEHRGERRDRQARKEKVLHTRISEDLAEDIRRMADDLRVPVSNIVRNVLEDAFSVVEVVTDNVGELIEDVLGEADAARDRLRTRHQRRARTSPRRAQPAEDAQDVEEPAEPIGGDFSDVIGWQALRLNGAQRCGRCDSPLERGQDAFAGVTARGVGGVFLCPTCMEERP
jgi:hypothetical protein